MSPGTIVGGYRIQRVIGAGGMGTVYLAKHPSLPRMDALKVLSAELSRDYEFRTRFEREANLAAGLDHPNIVKVYNRGEEHGQLWISMQYVDGTDASAELARDPHSMNPLRALRIVTEVGKGLDHAHRRGLMHRDVKPANFLLSTAEDEEERVLLTDFGVAKSSDDTTELTQTGAFVATIAYAPPEQLSGQPLDHRADIYSLGCAFFKLLTGRNPYPSTQPAMVMMGHLHEPVPLATSVNPGLPQAIDHVFARAMAKNPAERFNTCREFTDAAANALIPGYNPMPTNTSPTYPIVYDPSRPSTDPRTATVGTQYSHGGGYTPPSTTTLTPTPPKNRKPLLIGGGVLAVIIALAAGIGIWSLGGNDPGTTGPSTTASAPGPSLAPIARARKDNPAFEGKPILMVDVSDGSTEADMGIYLIPSPQTTFLGELGFTYNVNYIKNGDEVSPRPIARTDRYTTFTNINTGYIIAVRSDSKAGGGGLLGLPSSITGSKAKVIVVDEPATVSALRNWNNNSEQLLLDKLVPILRSQVR